MGFPRGIRKIMIEMKNMRKKEMEGFKLKPDRKMASEEKYSFITETGRKH